LYRWPTAGDELVRYASWLTTAGVDRGLVGPREIPRIWERHILNCAVAVDVAPLGSTVLDVGSGAGLPGLVWALIRPDLQLSLLEPSLRRTRFLTEVVHDLGVGDRVRVIRGRAEEVAGQLSADVVTSRAVAPWTKLAQWSLPLVAPGGIVAALKGASAETELQQAAGPLRRAGAGSGSVLVYGADELSQPTHVVVLRPDERVGPALGAAQ
jgi:16S rRNA (guanine527-N7)-methyltransferase